MLKNQTVTTSDVASTKAVLALHARIAAADATERTAIRDGLLALKVRPGIKSGQAGRIRALLNGLER